MKQEVSVCIFAGHTGGHLFPAIAYAERFKKKFSKSHITLITSPKAVPILNASSSAALDQTIFLNEFPFFSGNPLKTLIFLLKFALAFFTSFRLLQKIKPDLCVGFGSYVSYPGMRLACWKKIPTVIHEQNIIPGKATQWLAPHADLTLMSFKETRWKTPPAKAETAGLPVRSKLYEAARGFNRSFEVPAQQKPLHIFITGGSQGASRLNEVILESFSHLSPEERQKIAVTHITGTKDLETVTGKYKTMDLSCKTYSFYENMQELYRQSDLAVTRAGANTLFELSLFGVPSIVVPFPHAAENHQELNARVFESRGALQIQREETLRPEQLAEQFRKMMNPEVRRQYSEKIRTMAPEDAAEKLVELSCELLSKEGR